MNELPRRKAVLHGLQIALAATLWPLVSDRAQGGAACVNAASESMRSALEYTDPAPDSAQACINCGFFTMDKSPCGNCMLVKGPVSSTGHCHSWSDKNG